MSNWLKVAIAVGAALLVGLLFGYLFGSAGKGGLEAAAKKAKAAEAVAKTVAHEAEQQRDARAKSIERRLALLRAKEQLFRALLQLKSRNFGIAAQRLRSTSVQLQRAAKQSKGARRRAIEDVRKEIGGAHTLTMGLDPVAQVQVERLINMVHALPGAR